MRVDIDVDEYIKAAQAKRGKGAAAKLRSDYIKAFHEDALVARNGRWAADAQIDLVQDLAGAAARLSLSIRSPSGREKVLTEDFGSDAGADLGQVALEFALATLVIHCAIRPHLRSTVKPESAAVLAIQGVLEAKISRLATDLKKAA